MINQCPLRGCFELPDPESTIEFTLPGVDGVVTAHFCAMHHHFVCNGTLTYLSLAPDKGESKIHEV